MGGMQTILALLAVTLFSSLTLGSLNNLTSQGDILYSSYLNLQGQSAAESFFEKLNCELLGKDITLTQLYTNYHNVNDTFVIPDLPKGSNLLSFSRHIRTEYCRKDGTYSSSATNYVKVKLYMSASCGYRGISVGTPSNPIIRIYTSAGL